MNEKITLKSLLKNKDSDAALYVCGIIAGLLTVLWELIIKITHLPQICFIYSTTGFFCPGCGGTRAFIYLIHGRFIKSFIYHPFVIYAFIIGAVFYVSQTLRYLTHGKVKGIHFRIIFIFIGIFIIVINWLVKNIALLFWSINLLN